MTADLVSDEQLAEWEAVSARVPVVFAADLTLVSTGDEEQPNG